MLNDNQEEKVNLLYSATDSVLKTIKFSISGLTDLLNNNEKIYKILAERFIEISEILANNKLSDCLKDCNFANDTLFELSFKTFKKYLKKEDFSQNIVIVQNIFETNYKKLGSASSELNKVCSAILKFIYEFLKCLQTLISSTISEEAMFVAYNSSNEYRDKDKHMVLISKSLEKFCPDRYKLLQKSGVMGRTFDKNANMYRYSVFNFDDSGKIIIDAHSYTQGIIKNCYFISALRSLSNNPNATKYLRNCFDKMTDDDLKFAKEKISNEKLNKEFTIEFYDIDFDDLSIDELTHLGLMNKSESKLKCKPTKVYYKIRCKDLTAAGIESKGSELWPLIIGTCLG